MLLRGDMLLSGHSRSNSVQTTVASGWPRGCVGLGCRHLASWLHLDMQPPSLAHNCDQRQPHSEIAAGTAITIAHCGPNEKQGLVFIDFLISSRRTAQWRPLRTSGTPRHSQASAPPLQRLERLLQPQRQFTIVPARGSISFYLNINLASSKSHISRTIVANPLPILIHPPRLSTPSTPISPIATLESTSYLHHRHSHPLLLTLSTPSPAQNSTRTTDLGFCHHVPHPPLARKGNMIDSELQGTSPLLARPPHRPNVRSGSFQKAAVSPNTKPCLPPQTRPSWLNPVQHRLSLA